MCGYSHMNRDLGHPYPTIKAPGIYVVCKRKKGPTHTYWDMSPGVRLEHHIARLRQNGFTPLYVIRVGLRLAPRGGYRC